MNDPIVNYTEKIDKILFLIGASDIEKKEIKSNLLVTLCLETINSLIPDLINNKKDFSKFSELKPETDEECEKIINEAVRKMNDLGIDPMDRLKETGKILLKNFIKDLEPDVPSKKLSKIRKILED